VLEQRLISRPSDQFRDFAVSRKLNSDVLKIHRPADTLLDTSRLSVHELAKAVIADFNQLA
jgi:RNase adaptor protein for sRNA GlmZ degradation